MEFGETNKSFSDANARGSCLGRDAGGDLMTGFPLMVKEAGVWKTKAGPHLLGLDLHVWGSSIFSLVSAGYWPLLPAGPRTGEKLGQALGRPRRSRSAASL